MITDFAYYKRKANFKAKYSGADNLLNMHPNSPAGWFEIILYRTLITSSIVGDLEGQSMISL